MNILKMRIIDSREPHLFDLTNFAEDEMTLESDPLYSRDTAGQDIEKDQKFIKSKRFTVNTVKAEESVKVDISKKLKTGIRCALCYENHELKIVFSFYKRHWKSEVNFFIIENVMNVLKKLPRSIIQNLE